MGIHGSSAAATSVVQRKASTEPGAGGSRESSGTTDGRYGNVYRLVIRNGVWMVSDPSKSKDTITAKLDKYEIVQPADLGANQPFNQVEDPKDKWWKVEVLHGTHVGEEGWVMPNLLGTVFEVEDEGTQQHTGKSGDGTVTVCTGQELNALGRPFGNNIFSLSYQGEDADKADWLQFINREVIGMYDKSVAKHVR